MNHRQVISKWIASLLRFPPSSFFFILVYLGFCACTSAVYLGPPRCSSLRDQYLKQMLFCGARRVLQRSRRSSRDWWWDYNHLTQQPQQLWAILSKASGVLDGRTNRRDPCVYFSRTDRLFAVANVEKVVAGVATREGSTLAAYFSNSGQ